MIERFRAIALAAILFAACVAVLAAPPASATNQDDAVPAGGNAAAVQAQERTSMKHLTRISIAVHKFSSANKYRLPQNLMTKDAKPLLRIGESTSVVNSVLSS